jgi:hypothetical protein
MTHLGLAVFIFCLTSIEAFPLPPPRDGDMMSGHDKISLLSLVSA